MNKWWSVHRVGNWCIVIPQEDDSTLTDEINALFGVRIRKRAAKETVE